MSVSYFRPTDIRWGMLYITLQSTLLPRRFASAQFRLGRLGSPDQRNKDLHVEEDLSTWPLGRWASVLASVLPGFTFVIQRDLNDHDEPTRPT